jgi:hypothetical protein
MNCTTHHHACACREAKLKALLREVFADAVAEKNRELGMEPNNYNVAYMEINELWVEMYGRELFEDGGN